MLARVREKQLNRLTPVQSSIRTVVPALHVDPETYFLSRLRDAELDRRW